MQQYCPIIRAARDKMGSGARNYRIKGGASINGLLLKCISAVIVLAVAEAVPEEVSYSAAASSRHCRAACAFRSTISPRSSRRCIRAPLPPSSSNHHPAVQGPQNSGPSRQPCRSHDQAAAFTRHFRCGLRLHPEGVRCGSRRERARSGRRVQSKRCRYSARPTRLDRMQCWSNGIPAT
jgi:hypothetical protein